MRTFVALGCMLLALAGCRREDTVPAVETTDTAVQTTAGTTGTASDTITPGTLRPATTATGTLAPVPATRTTTSAPPGTTVTDGREPAPPRDAAPAPTSRIIDGRPIFQARCATCHGAAGERVTGRRALRSTEVQRQSQEQIAKSIRAAVAHRNITLSDDELKAVAAYVKALD